MLGPALVGHRALRRHQGAAVPAQPRRRLGRANVRRFEFEALRDSLLVFSGRLDPASGGHPVNLTEELYSYRRSVYGYIDRGRVADLMLQFDFTDPRMPASKRTSTVVPQQALFLMNSPLVVEAVMKLVARPEVAAFSDDRARVTALYRILFQRPPRPEEVELGL